MNFYHIHKIYKLCLYQYCNKRDNLLLKEQMHSDDTTCLFESRLKNLTRPDIFWNSKENLSHTINLDFFSHLPKQRCH